MAEEDPNPPVGGPFWQLVHPGDSNVAYRLPEAMIFVGREECDITVQGAGVLSKVRHGSCLPVRNETSLMLQARSVDKRHAVIMYDYCDKRFKVKDLNSANGTFVNEVRIPVQTYIQLDSMDLLRFGFAVYQVVRVPGPEESMTHELQNGYYESSSRSSSPLQLSIASAPTGREGRASSEEPPRNAVCRNLSAPPALVAATSSSSLQSGFSEDSLLGDGGAKSTNAIGIHGSGGATVSPATTPGSRVPVDAVRTLGPCGPRVPDLWNATTGTRERRSSTAPTRGSTTRNSLRRAAAIVQQATASSQTSPSHESAAQPIAETVTPAAPPNSLVPESTAKAPLEVLASRTTPPPSTLSPVSELPPPIQQEQTVNTPSPSDTTSSSGGGTTGGEGSSSSPSSSSAPPPPQLHPMAFTVDLTDLGGSKRLDIGDSISKFVPRHRRNLSISRQEEAKQRLEKQQQDNAEQPAGRAKTPVSPPRNPTAGIGATQQQPLPPSAPGVAQLQMRRAGYHSEGYFSSDQEEDLSTKSDLSVRKAKGLDKAVGRTTNLAQEKRIKPDLPPVSSTSGRQTIAADKRSASLEESASEHFSRILGDALSPVRRQASCTSPPEKPQQAEAAADAEDNVSEAGTYTIDKESPSHEEKRARSEIDVVFGVDVPTSPTCDTRTFTRPKPSSETNGLLHQRDESVKAASYRGGPNWIKEWAAQVAEQQQQQREEVVLPSHVRGRVPSPSLGVPSSPLLSPVMGWPPTPTEPPPPSRGVRHKLMTSASPALSDHSDPTDSPARLRRPIQLQDTETESYLRATESVVTAMQARVTAAEEGPSTDELSAQLRARLRALEHRAVVPQPTPPPQQQLAGPARRLVARAQQQRVSGEGQSDSSSEAGDKPRSRADSAGPHTSLRRARVEAEEAEKSRAKPSPVSSSAPARGVPRVAQQSVSRPPRKLEPARPTNSSPGIASKPPVHHSASAGNFSRADGGRFSLRAGKVANQVPVIPKSRPTNAAPTRTPVSAGAKKSSGRSNSSLNAREMEFQNWKRRKSYDPMKAAAEGKKKAEAARKSVGHAQQQASPNVMTQSAIMPATTASPNSSPLNSILRSASFHGTGAMARPLRHQHGSAATSEDEATLSAEEEDEVLVVQQYSPATASPRHARPSPLPPPLRCTSQPPDPALARKSSLDETMDGSNSRGFTRNTTPTSSVRSRGKLEALDNLVIAAIHGFSNKIKGSSHNVLSKLRVLFQEDPEKASMLEETLALLEEGEPPTSSPSKSPSKELSGTLRNLKKLEHVFSVLDDVLFGDEEDLEEEEMEEEEEELSDLDADQLQAN